MTDNPTIEPTLAFVRFARKTFTEDHGRGRGTEEASVSLPLEVPAEGVASQDFLKSIAAALGDAKVEVWTALGIQYEFDTETGNLVEKVVTPAPRQQSSGGNGGNRSSGGRPAPSGGDVPNCGICGGAVYDNRASKRGNGPDFKCKDRDACGAAAWLQDDGTIGKWKP